MCYKGQMLNRKGSEEKPLAINKQNTKIPTTPTATKPKPAIPLLNFNPLFSASQSQCPQ